MPYSVRFFLVYAMEEKLIQEDVQTNYYHITIMMKLIHGLLQLIFAELQRNFGYCDDWEMANSVMYLKLLRKRIQ